MMTEKKLSLIAKEDEVDQILNMKNLVRKPEQQEKGWWLDLTPEEVEKKKKEYEKKEEETELALNQMYLVSHDQALGKDKFISFMKDNTELPHQSKEGTPIYIFTEVSKTYDNKVENFHKICGNMVKECTAYKEDMGLTGDCLLQADQFLYYMEKKYANYATLKSILYEPLTHIAVRFLYVKFIAAEKFPEPPTKFELEYRLINFNFSAAPDSVQQVEIAAQHNTSEFAKNGIVTLESPEGQELLLGCKCMIIDLMASEDAQKRLQLFKFFRDERSNPKNYTSIGGSNAKSYVSRKGAGIENLLHSLFENIVDQGVRTEHQDVAAKVDEDLMKAVLAKELGRPVQDLKAFQEESGIEMTLHGSQLITHPTTSEMNLHRDFDTSKPTGRVKSHTGIIPLSEKGFCLRLKADTEKETD